MEDNLINLKIKIRELTGENYRLKKQNIGLLSDNLHFLRMAARYQREINTVRKMFENEHSKNKTEVSQ